MSWANPAYIFQCLSYWPVVALQTTSVGPTAGLSAADIVVVAASLEQLFYGQASQRPGASQTGDRIRHPILDTQTLALPRSQQLLTSFL